MDGLFHDWLRLREATRQARLDFIRTDLDVCLTFAGIVESEYGVGNHQHAERTLVAAEKAYSDSLRFFTQERGLTQEIDSEFRVKFKHARERLDLVHAPSPRGAALPTTDS